MTQIRYAAATLLCLSLAACSGGGGGGGGGGAPSGPSVSISPASLSATFTAGQSVPITVTATTSSVVNQTVFVTIIDSVGVLTPNVTISANSATSYAVTLFTSPSLAAGTHTGSVRVNICYDAGCARHLGNSPLNVPYTFQVAAANRFSATPATLTLSQPVGASTEASLSVNPSQSLSGPLFFRVGNSPALLDGSATFTEIGNGSYTAKFSINPALNPGRNTGSLIFSVCRDTSCGQHLAGSPFQVPYDITVVPRQTSAFALSPTTLTGSYVVGSVATLNLSLTGVPLPRPLYAQVTNSDDLLNPAATVNPNANNTQFTIRVQTSAAKAVGRYTGAAALTLCAVPDCSVALADASISVPYDVEVLPPVSFNPETLTGRFSAGFPFAAQAIVTRNTNGPVFLSVSDGGGAFQDVHEFSQLSDNTYSLGLYALRSLTPQQRRGNVTLRVCSDFSCTNEVPGSPVSLPYDLTVESLRPLARYDGVDDWTTYQGNAAHTGYVPIDVDSANIVPRWSWSTPDQANGYGGISTLAVNGNRVFVSAEKHLYALDEHGGAALWDFDFNDVQAFPDLSSVVKLNPPAAAGDQVYVATSGHGGTYMWAFAASTGAQRFRTPFTAQWEAYFAPTPYGDTVYTNGGTYGGMYAFDVATGNQRFFSNLQQFDEWTPAVDENYAYAYIGGQTANTPAQLNVIDRQTGAHVASILDHSYQWAGYSMDTAPVIGAAGSVTAVNVGNSSQNSLINFDTVGESIRWSVAGGYTGTPAYRGGVFYAVNRAPLRLEARSEATGALLWSWIPPLGAENTFIGDVLVTNNVVFVSTNRAVYGIDLATHNIVWTWPKTGRLTLSANGVLYISMYAPTRNANDGDIVAFDLNR
jgi:hypothetical protein